MKTFILTLTILFLCGLSNAVERINDNCYKFDGVLVCEAKKVVQPEIPKIETPKEDVIVKTFYTYGNEER